MIDSIASKIARTIKNTDPDNTVSVEVMKYALIIYFNTLLIMIEALCIGWITGKFQETVVTLTAIVILRLFSGGIHMRTTLGCNIVSVCIVTLIPHIPVNGLLTNIFTLACVPIIVILSPNIDSQTYIDKKYYKYLKAISLIIVCSNFVFHSPLLGLSFLVQCATLILLKRREVE